MFFINGMNYCKVTYIILYTDFQWIKYNEKF